MKTSAVTVAELLQDDAFVAWVLDPTPALDARWTAIRHAHPANRIAMEEAEDFINKLRDEVAKTYPSEEQGAQLWAKIRTEIECESEAKQQPEAPVVPFRRGTPWRWWAVAASLVLVGVLTWLGLREVSREPVPTTAAVLPSSTGKPLRSRVNASEKPLLVTLSDGSSVLLQKNSRLDFPENFGANREVYLQGEAFFEVAKDPNRPFFVFTNSLVTKVLGTSFTVRAFAEEKATVSVRTGRVEVFANRPEVVRQRLTDRTLRGTVLTPNETFRADAGTVVPTPEVPVEAARVPDFRYDDTPIATVFAELEATYGVRIQYDPARLRTCYLTANLTDEPFGDKLNLACKSIGASYEIAGNQITVYSNGCE